MGEWGSASDYNIDYAILASTRMEPLLRAVLSHYLGCAPAASPMRCKRMANLSSPHRTPNNCISASRAAMAGAPSLYAAPGR